MLAVRTLFAVLALASAATFLPQGGIPPTEVQFVTYVDPVNGGDGSGRVHDPDFPFKTLQKAIDETYNTLVTYNSTGTKNTQGVVYALPGIYGPVNAGSNGPHASGDAFPIKMRDRVHVKGVAARRCILRGVGQATGDYFWPTSPTGTTGLTQSAEVLLTLQYVHPSGNFPGPHPPWFLNAASPLVDTPEVFDGFTFEGGDIQVFAGSGGTQFPYPIEAVVSNCVFDMRDNWKVDPESPAVIRGPYIGAMMTHTLVTAAAYVDIRLLLANNTFVMGRYGANGWTEVCRSEAVGVIDVSNPTCSINPNDCDTTLRGIGNPGLINNVFRTPPASVASGPYAMLGIDATDTLVWLDNEPQTVQTNAFASSRVGSSNGHFYSLPVVTGIVFPATSSTPDYWDCGGFATQTSGGCGTTCGNVHSCTSAPVPTPRVPIYDTVGSEKDPGFVGEYLNLPSVGLTNYVDWRLLPSSPLKDQGYLPSYPAIGLLNDSLWDLDEVLPFEALTLDGESYGNPRVVDTFPDIGADEVQFFSMAGSWANDSNSHNQRGFLNPDGPPGLPIRYIILPKSAAGVTISTGTYVKINGKRADPTVPPPAPTAWFQPPATLASPAVNPALPTDYRTKYIAFNNGANVPTPWAFTVNVLTDQVSYSPIGGATGVLNPFVRLTIADDECSPQPCAHHYFNIQALVRADAGSADLLWSNLQVEYR